MEVADRPLHVGLADGHRGRHRQRAAAGQQDRRALGRRRTQDAVARQRGDRRVLETGPDVVERQDDVGLVGEVADHLDACRGPGGEFVRAAAELERDQRCAAYRDGHLRRRGRVEAVVRHDLEGCSAGESGVGREDHGTAVGRQRRAAVRRGQHAVEHDVAVRIGRDGREIDADRQPLVREHERHRRRDLRAEVHPHAEVRVHHLAIVAIGVAVAVDVGGRTAGVHHDAVRAVDHAVEVHVTRDRQFDGVVAGRAVRAGQAQLVEPLAIERVQRDDAIAGALHRQRREAGDHRRRCVETRAAGDRDPQDQLAAVRRGDLARPHAERVERRGPGREVAIRHVAGEFGRAAEIGDHGERAHRSVGGVLDAEAGLPDHDDAGESAGFVRVARTRAGREVAHGEQFAGRAVLVDERRAVGRDRTFDATSGIAEELQRRAVLGRHAVVAHEEPLAGRRDDLLHAVRGIEHVARAVGAGEREVGAVEAGRHRVVGLRRRGGVELRAALREQHVGRRERPCAAVVGDPGGTEELHRAHRLGDGREAERRARAVRQRHPDARAFRVRVVHAERLAARDGHVRFEADVAARQRPAGTERTRCRVEARVLPHERVADAAEVDGQIDVAAPVVTGLRVGVDLDEGGCRRAGPAADVAGRETQRVEAVRQARRIECRERAVDRCIAFGEQRECAVRAVRDLELPEVEVDVLHGAEQRRRRAQAAAGQRTVQRDDRRGPVGGVPRLQLRGCLADATIGIGRDGAHVELAGGRRGDVRAAVGVERDFLAGDEHTQRRDRGEAVGDGVHEHALPGDRGEARGQFEQHRRRHRFERGTQHDRLAIGQMPVVRDDRDDVLARLAGARRPREHARVGIERRAFGQADGAEREIGADIRIGRAHRERAVLADQEAVVELVEHRRTIDVRDADRDVEMHRRAAWIGGREAHDVIAGLREAGRPLELAAASHEQRTVGQVGCGHHDRIRIGVGRDDGEDQLGAFAGELRDHRHEHGQLVRVGDHDVDRLAAAAVAVGGDERDAARAGRVECRPPREHTGQRIEHGAGGEIFREEADDVAVGVERAELEREHGAFRDGAVADRHEHGRAVGVAHDDPEVARRFADGARAVVAAVAHGDGRVVIAEVGRRRRPDDLGETVDRRRDDARAGRKPGEFVRKRILIEVGHAHRDAHGLADDADDVAEIAESRRFVVALDVDDEHVAAGDRFADAVAVVARDDAQRVVAAIADDRCEPQRRGAVAVIGERDEIGRRESGQFAFHRQHERIALGVGRPDRDLADGVARQRDVRDRLDDRRTVQVEHPDRDDDVGRQRRAGAVAVVDGVERDEVLAGLGPRRCPAEVPGVGVERRTGRQVVRRDGHGARPVAGLEDLAVRVTEQRRELRIVRIERVRRDHQRLAFVQHPAVLRIEDRRTVRVRDGEA